MEQVPKHIHKQLSSKRPFFCRSIKTHSPALTEEGRPYNGKVNTQWHLWAFCSKWSSLATNYKHALPFSVLWNTHFELRVNVTPPKPPLLSSKSSESTHLIWVSAETRAHSAAKWQNDPAISLTVSLRIHSAAGGCICITQFLPSA